MVHFVLHCRLLNERDAGLDLSSSSLEGASI